MSHKIKPKQLRAYVREGITRIPIDVQKFEIQKAADEFGLRVEWYTGIKSKPKTIAEERDLWAHQLKCDEIGIVHSLSVLRLTRKQIGGTDPKADFSGLMASINALYLMEASTGITSKDRAKWRRVVTVVTENPPPGSKSMTKEQARKTAKQGWKTRDRGVVATWESDARKKEREHLILYWKASDTAKLAAVMLPEFIELMGGGVFEELRGISESSLRRICKTKRT